MESLSRTIIVLAALAHAALLDSGTQASGRPLADQEPEETIADTLRFVEVVDGQVLGSWRMWQEAPSRWGYSEARFRRFERAEWVELDDSGLPVQLRGTGRISDGIPWFERFDRRGDTAQWSTPVTRGEAAIAGPGFYKTVYPAIDLGLLARALLRRPSRSLALLPEGQAQLELVGERVVEAAERRRSVRLFAVHGVDLLPRYVWLDEEDSTFGDEWSIREGWEASAPILRAAVDSAVSAHLQLLRGTVTRGQPSGPLAIRGARLFNPETGTVEDGVTIVLAGEQVAAVGPDGTVAMPPEVQVLEATGQMVVPGLWDMHAHLRDPAGQDQWSWFGGELLHLAAGVTSVRDVGSHVGALAALREAIDAGEAAGPRILVAGFVYDTAWGVDVIEDPIATADEARARVDHYSTLGFSQIKLHIVSESALAQAAIERAKERGMRVIGHLPDDMTSWEAIDVGFDEMTHLWWMLWSIPRSNEEAIAAGETFDTWHQVLADLTPESPSVGRYVARLAERGVAVDPTIGYFLSPSTPPEFIAEVVDRLPAPVARLVEHRPWGAQYFPRSPLARSARERTAANLLALLPVLYDAGVGILPGSDTWPGFGLHYELELYARAGIPPSAVLQLATLGAAREMGMASRLGSVEPGKLADLILVDGDPTQSIEDLRRVTLVVKGGEIYEPAAIYGALGIEPCCD